MLQEMINAYSSHGGTVIIPAGEHVLTEPLNMLSGVNLRGDSRATTTLKCTNGQAVIVAKNISKFSVSDLRLIGNRSGTTATNDGILLQGCSYFNVRNINIQKTNSGLNIKTSWCGSVANIVAEQCQGYGYQLSNTCTSLVLSQTTAWGTGGGWKMIGCLYCTILSPACDHCDAGNSPNDPFGPNGSGGNYKKPAHVFYASGSVVTINSPGCENGYSQWLYSEGSNICITTPVAYNMQCHAAPWRFIELRGTNSSEVIILQPRFTEIRNCVGEMWNRNGVFVERPGTQRVVFSSRPEFHGFGDYAYPSAGHHVLTVN